MGHLLYNNYNNYDIFTHHKLRDNPTVLSTKRCLKVLINSASQARHNQTTKTDADGVMDVARIFIKNAVKITKNKRKN